MKQASMSRDCFESLWKFRASEIYYAHPPCCPIKYSFIHFVRRQIFHPDLNLFSRTTEDQRMYPCAASAVNPEHLRLFHLAGRLFGRTVFEGIVADLPFASFFLAKLLHGHAFLDDLQSLDPQLYKNLIFVKHYDGDVEDLCLTFAVDEEMFGQTTTVDLIPGGRACEVNNQNKTKYIHAMADYYMNQRIRRQCQEFATGFKEVGFKLSFIAWCSVIGEPATGDSRSMATNIFDASTAAKISRWRRKLCP